MAEAPAPGTRWVKRNGKHAGSAVEVVKTSDLSVYVNNRGGGEEMGNQKVDQSRVNRITLETFSREYVPYGSVVGGETGRGGSFRRHGSKSLPPEIAPELAMNGVAMTSDARLHFQIVDITPDMAKAWLARGGNNRVPTKSRVGKLSSAIRRGEWRVTGDSIKLDNEGHVRDGRHRLLAVVDAGMPIRSLVVRGVDEDAFTVFDTGKNRTPADVMGIAGYKNRVAIASNGRALILIEASGRLDPPTRREFEPLFSNTALLAYVRAHPDVEEGVQMATRLTAQGLAGGSGLLGTLCTLLLRADAEAARLFTERLASGASLDVDSPILRFRNRLFTDRRMSGALADREHLLALGIKAWNSWRAGESLKQLTWHGSRTPGGRAGEAFPGPFLKLEPRDNEAKP